MLHGKGVPCGGCKARLFADHPIEVDVRRFECHGGRNDIPVVADFRAPWCGPCRARARIFDRAAKELELRAWFVQVNVNNEPELATQRAVQGTPALFVLKTGSVVARQAGFVNPGTKLTWVRQFSFH